MSHLPAFSKFMILALAAFLACSPAQKRGDLNTLVLDDFESSSSLKLWQGPGSISMDYAAHGKSSLLIDLSDRRTRYLVSESLPGDWSGYEILKFDIYNPNDRIQIGEIQIFDKLGTDEEAQINGQSYRGEKIFLNKGWNHFEFNLKKAMVEDGNRPLALDKIRRFRLDFGGLNGKLYLDNFRLVKGEEGAATASSVDPRDCRVVIVDRDVYPALAGPADKIKPSQEIVQLHTKAEEEINRLRGLVEKAEAMGQKPLYYKIALHTADIGLKVRSQYVWFQNEEEEKKILEYIISSCAESASLLTDIISALENNTLDRDRKELLNVPPYPPFKGLKQRDGFFRYENGDPVIIFAMHGISDGPFLEYFATYNHVQETYTVGGGSRMDIESSPVYEAFQKYPDTHRVGWDGWCGHLIKDRWSMGGKKENVVICLESPHIREAVLQYMKRRYEHWKNDPNLLYNIMAYELMYICYCDRSQEMFRNWLQKKYSSLAALNEIWGTSYRSFAEITAPSTRHSRPLPDVNRAAWYDWASFNTRRFTDYLKWVKSEMRKLDQVTPINAGGTSSMLSSGNSTSGIDEEMIINEVDDAILNESGGTHIFSDLFLSLSAEKKVMVEPEMGGGVHNILLHFLHGKSAIAKWLWGKSVSTEYPGFAESSVPQSWDIPLSEVAEVLSLGLDVRRLGSEIAEFTRPKPEIAILYAKSSIVQVPPELILAGRTPYIDALYSAWEGSRYLGCRVGFVSENQIMAGKLSGFKLLIVPAVKYLPPEVFRGILKFVHDGGRALVVPESFLFDQYARQNDRLATSLGISVKDVTLPEILGQGELVQNYDQSRSQTIVYGGINRKIKTGDKDIFQGRQLTLRTSGLVQSIDTDRNTILGSFEDGKPAIVLVKKGRGSIYYLASPLVAADYHLILEPLAREAGLNRPVTGVDAGGNLITRVEVRGVERKGDYLVYASNLAGEPVEFDLQGQKSLGAVYDLRACRTQAGAHIKLGPYAETIFRVEKRGKR